LIINSSLGVAAIPRNLKLKIAEGAVLSTGKVK